jgi:hypothetical protein
VSRVALTETVLEATNPTSFGRGLEVFVYSRGTEEEATLHSAEEGGTTISQPLTTDKGGRPRSSEEAMAWLDEGSYDLSINGQDVPFEAAKGGSGGLSEAEVKALAEGVLGTLDALKYKGIKDCSANPKFPTANAGDVYLVSVAGKIGGGSGYTVSVGDLLLCNTDGAAEGTKAEVGSKWDILDGQAALEGAVAVEKTRALAAEELLRGKLKALGEVEGNVTPNLNEGNVFTAKLKGNATFKKPTNWPEGFGEAFLLVELNGHTLTLEGVEGAPSTFSGSSIVELPLLSVNGGTTILAISAAEAIANLETESAELKEGLLAENARAETKEAEKLAKASNLGDVENSGESRQNLHIPELKAAHAVSTTNVASLSGLPTVDGFTLEAGQIVLLTAQTEAKNNGPWEVGVGAWVRTTDFSGGAVVSARKCAVINGTVNAHSEWLLNTNSNVTVGTTAQTWVLLLPASVATELALKAAKANNLSDLASAATARTNLGLGTAATQASSAFDAAGAAATEETRAKAAEAELKADPVDALYLPDHVKAFKNPASSESEIRQGIAEPRNGVNSGFCQSAVLLVSGTPKAVRIWVPKGKVIKGVMFLPNTIDTEPTKRTHMWTELQNSAHAQLAVSADFTSSVKTPLEAGEVTSLDFETPYTVPEDMWVFAVFVWVSTISAEKALQLNGRTGASFFKVSPIRAFSGKAGREGPGTRTSDATATENPVWLGLS